MLWIGGTYKYLESEFMLLLIKFLPVDEVDGPVSSKLASRTGVYGMSGSSSSMFWFVLRGFSVTETVTYTK